MCFKVVSSTKFKQDLARSIRRGLDVSRLDAVVSSLANGDKLRANYRDHALAGNYKVKRECHIAPDWLLIYEYIEDVLMLDRTGSHSDLFR